MTQKRNSKNSIKPKILAIGLPLIVFLAAPLAAQDPVYDSGLFQIDPTIPGNADILGSPGQFDAAGPDWEDIFNSDRTLRDDYPAGGNGVPDYIDLYGGQWGVFATEGVSGGVDLDMTALPGNNDFVVRKVVAPAHDIGNAYVYSTFDSQANLVIYAGAERVQAGDSFLEFEFNQAHIRLGHGPPWQITGDKTDNDLLVRVTFAGGFLTTIEVKQWLLGGFQTIETVFNEDCNAGQTVCVACNAVPIDGGPWPNYDPEGDPEQIGGSRFAELGINVGGLLGTQPDYTSIQVRTPEDIAFGYFAEGN